MALCPLMKPIPVTPLALRLRKIRTVGFVGLPMGLAVHVRATLRPVQTQKPRRETPSRS